MVQNYILVVQGSQFEGDSPNAHETTINVTEPTQDNTITLINPTGTVALTNSFKIPQHKL